MSPYKVAVYLYPGGDLLDFAGPCEVYNTAPRHSTEQLFEVTSFAHHNPVKSQVAAMVITPTAIFSEIASKIEEFDIFIIPGANGDTIESLISSTEGQQLLELIKKFATLPPREASGKRFLQSVCTGAILLAAAGVLAGRTAMTHHLHFDMLKEVADTAAGGDSHITVVKTRWADAGTTEAGVRIVNAGGVSSGIDTSLWVYEQFFGKEKADWVAEVVEFERRTEGWGGAA